MNETPLLHQYLTELTTRDGSDLYLTVGSKPMLRVNGQLIPAGDVMDGAAITAMIQEVLTPEQYQQFEQEWELNTAYRWNADARFRVNVFRQQQESGMVIRYISTKIPTFQDLKLPPIYEKLAMEKRGLVLLVGPTGSGKSSSLAAMIGHRNRQGSGHIITIEDPIEFIHHHQGCIITQRDVGIDTISFEAALKNALRQRPDVVLVGEVRDRAAMEHAINFAETGHLCLATLHANNSHQTIERILSFFPEERYRQVLMNLALNLRGILSQRLIANLAQKRSLVTEILLNEGLVKSLIEEGRTKEIRPLMEKNRDVGMKSFDQSLMELFVKGEISEEIALAESDNVPNLRLQITQYRSMKASQPVASSMPMSAPMMATPLPQNHNSGF
jgi:twitching motility protein PilU